MLDDRSPSEKMVHELGIGPGLEVNDNALLEQARHNVDETVERAHEKARERHEEDANDGA